MHKLSMLAVCSTALALAQHVELDMAHTGGAAIKGAVVQSSGRYLVKVRRVHKDGHVDETTTAPDSSGKFSIVLPAGDKLSAGDVVTATAVPKTTATGSDTHTVAAAQTALPKVSDVINSNPPAIVFAAATPLKVGATAKVTIASTDASAPADFTGQHTVMVTGADTITFQTKLKSVEALPAKDTLTITTAPIKAEGDFPAIKKVNGTPPIIQFSGPIQQNINDTINITLKSDDTGWPAELLGDQAATVIAADAVQLTKTVTLPSPQPDIATLSVSLTPPAASSATLTIEDPLCEWGRVRCYAYFGVIFSQDNGILSNTDPYFDFNLEWNWFKGRYLGKRGAKPTGNYILTGFFDTRLTQIPTAATTPAAAATPASRRTNASTTPAAPSTPSAVDAFGSSSKSPEVSGGLYYAPWMATMWPFDNNEYAMFPSLLVKGGVQGKLSGTVDPANLAFPNQGKSTFTFYSGGVRLGFLKFHPQRNSAHDLMSYIDFTVGKYRLYDFVGPNYSATTAALTAGDNVRHYGLRKVVEGRLKIPKVNVQIGMDANLGQGQNNLRFTVTTNARDIFTALFPTGSR